MKYKYFYNLVSKSKAETMIAVRLSGVPIEVEGTSQHAIVVATSSIEPRIGGVNEVRIVGVP